MKRDQYVAAWRELWYGGMQVKEILSYSEGHYAHIVLYNGTPLVVNTRLITVRNPRVA